MKIKLVTFDVTNTIIRIAGSVGQQYANVGKLYGVSADAEKLTQAFKSKWKKYNRELPNFGVTKGVSSYKWWTSVVKETFAEVGFDEKANDVDAIASHLFRHFSTAQAWEILPQAQSTLQTLKDRGAMVGAVSNFDVRLEKVLMNLELLHHFNFILTSEEVQHAKPEKEMFLEALRLADVAADEAVHVGDNVENDYFGAKNAGMTGVLFVKDINDIPNNVERNLCITNLLEITNLIDKIKLHEN